MKRTAVLIPTSHGPIEGVVHEPDGEPVASAVALPGAMDRSLANRKWARLADALADLGIVVLRHGSVDTGERAKANDEFVTARAHEAFDWFRERTAGLDFILCAHCYGARACVTYAAAHPPHALALVTPALHESLGGTNRRLSIHAWQVLSRIASRAGVRLPSRSQSLAPDIARALRAIGSTPQPWILLGERDYQWRAWLNPATAPAELDSAVIEIVPGLQLHSSRTLAAQDTMIERVAAWAARTLGDRVAS